MLLMTINSIFRAPERCLALALTVLCFSIMALLPHSAVSAAGQAATADPKRGEELFQKRCTSCHNLDREKEGPRLRGYLEESQAALPASITLTL
jgi:cytochrome c2